MRGHSRYVWVVFLVSALCLTGACERKAADHKADGRSESQQQPTAAEDGAERAAGDEGEAQEERPTAVEPAEGWTELDEGHLTEEEQERLDKARSAQKKLGKTLIGELTEAMKEDGHVGAVEVCNERAPQIAEEVREATDVEIGRTSFRLRNPDNTPPVWAEPYVEERIDETRVLRSEEDELAYLAPIQLQEMCTGCHGPSEQLAEGIPERIDELYPEDEATGFEVGDLRGWFWVEVEG